jgi:hypothetical protein
MISFNRFKLKLYYICKYPKDWYALLTNRFYRTFLMGRLVRTEIRVCDLTPGHNVAYDGYLQSRIVELQNTGKLTSVGGDIIVNKYNKVLDGNGRVTAYLRVAPLAIITVMKEEV